MAALEQTMLAGASPVKPVATLSLFDSYELPSYYSTSPKSYSAFPEFVGGLDRLKQLMRMVDPDSTVAEATGLTIHRLGDSLVLDRIISNESGEASPSESADFDISDPLLLLPSSLIDEVCDQSSLTRSGALLDVKNTFVHVRDLDEADEYLPRYHSAPPGGFQDTPSLHVSRPKPVRDTVINGLLRLPCDSAVPERSFDAMLPFLDKEQRSPMSRMNRSVEWNIAGFSVLLGCEIVLMETPNKTMLPADFSSVRELGDQAAFWPTKPEAREAWLETSLLQIEKVAWINRQQKCVEVVTSPAELCLEADVGGMLGSIKNVLTFLHAECRRQGVTYCLVRGSDGYCHLYDVTELPRDCNVLQVSRDLAVPIAKVCYSLIKSSKFDESEENRKRLLRKGWSLINEDHQGESELVALIALELASLEQSLSERIEILIKALSCYTDWKSETGQKLLVSTISGLVLSPDNSDIVLAHGLLAEVTAERREVECRGLVMDLNGKIGQLLLTKEGDWSNVAPRLAVGRLFTPPDNRLDRLKLAVDLLARSNEVEWEATALNELGAEFVQFDPLQAITLLVASIQKFSILTSLNESKQALLLAAVVLNMSRAVKKIALQSRSLSMRISAISLCLLANRIAKTLAPESVAGVELLDLATQLIDDIHSHFPETKEEVPDLARLASYLSLSETVIGKAYRSVTRRRIGTTKVSIGDIITDSDSLGQSSIADLARGCLNLSLMYATGLRAHVDYQIARLITETNGDGREALRHINKAIAGGEKTAATVCLQAVIQFKLGDVKGGICTLTNDLELGNEVRECLKTFCIQDVRSISPYPKSRPILEALIRNKPNQFISKIV